MDLRTQGCISHNLGDESDSGYQIGGTGSQSRRDPTEFHHRMSVTYEPQSSAL